MTDTFKRKLARAWGKHALAATTNMLATVAAKGYGDDLTPVAKLKPKPSPFKPAAYNPDDNKTWPHAPDGGKAAFLGGWPKRRLTAQDITSFDREGSGAGIVCRTDPADGRCVAAIDFDIPDAAGSDLVLATLRSKLATPFHIRRRGGYRGLVPLRVTDGVPKGAKLRTGHGHSLELIGAGQQFVALGPHACGTWRYWTLCDQSTETLLAEMPTRSELPELTLARFYQLFEAVADACGAVKDGSKRGHGGAPSPHVSGEPASGGGGFKLLPAEDFDHHALPDARKPAFLAVAAALPNTQDVRDDWIGCANPFVGVIHPR
jgi:hypothetical protein